MRDMNTAILLKPDAGGVTLASWDSTEGKTVKIDGLTPEQSVAIKALLVSFYKEGRADAKEEILSAAKRIV